MTQPWLTIMSLIDKFRTSVNVTTNLEKKITNSAEILTNLYIYIIYAENKIKDHDFFINNLIEN
ncbi:hypothetical protein BpHYR1_034927 [Brachionus plicatilis]|uniref:Uncharacterized protein n=1 Tax=Brachionus plicatilis TaxID=10195 RepID=A0A3M7S3B0_BRAPC|nr:hypothetical protein BpHYR1_034927 [Brachionus plicatilis]